MDKKDITSFINYLIRFGIVPEEDKNFLTQKINDISSIDELKSFIIDTYHINDKQIKTLLSIVDIIFSRSQQDTKVEVKIKKARRRRKTSSSVAIEKKLMAIEGATRREDFYIGEGSKRYELKELIGMGGMGSIYRALDKTLNRHVALKLLRPEFKDNPLFLRQFLYEATLTANLEHPNIIPVYDIGILDSGELYYTMKLVPKTTLKDVLNSLREDFLKNSKIYTLFNLLMVFRNVCLGVAFAHEKGVVHRDLKPSNIAIGDNGDVYILDWGIARKLSGEEVAFKSEIKTIGTYEYSDPLQILDKERQIGFKNDIYSLGVILYEILTLKLPYDDYSSIEAIKKNLKKEIPLPSKVTKWNIKSELLDIICLKCLDSKGENRYRTVFELLKDFDVYIFGYKEKEYLAEFAKKELNIAKKIFKQYVSLLSEKKSLEKTLKEFSKQNLKYASEDIQYEISKLENRAKLLETLVGKAYFEISTHLSRAQGLNPEDKEINQFFLDLCLLNFKEAKEKIDINNMIYFGNLVLEISKHLGITKYHKKGKLSIRSFPEGVMISFAKFENLDKNIGFEHGKIIGRTPLMDMELEPGAYLIMARKVGYKDSHNFVFVFGDEYTNLLVTLDPVDIYVVEGGREHELHEVILSFEDSRIQSDIRYLTLSSFEGAATSFIINGFKDYLVELPYYVVFIHGNARELFNAIPFQIVSDIIKFRAGIKHGERRDLIRKKIVNMLKIAFSKGGEKVLTFKEKETIEYLSDFIGALPGIDIPMKNSRLQSIRKSSQILKEKILESVFTYFKKLTEWLPVVIIVDNAQWMDPSSYEFFKLLKQEGSRMPLFAMFVTNVWQHQSETDRCISLINAFSDYTVKLTPLNSHMIRRNVGKILQGPVSDALVDFILKSSGGINFVIDHILSHLIKQHKIFYNKKIKQYDLKKNIKFQKLSLKDAVMQKFEEFSKEEQTVLKYASILGRVFWKDPLVHLIHKDIDDTIESLIKKGWITEHSHSKYPDTEEFSFTLNILKDIVYESIPEDERVKIHEKIAEWLWKKFRGGIEEIALIGFHYERSKKYRDSGIFYQRLGDFALRYGSFEEAKRYYNKALSMNIEPSRKEEILSRLKEIETLEE